VTPTCLRVHDDVKHVLGNRDVGLAGRFEDASGTDDISDDATRANVVRYSSIDEEHIGPLPAVEIGDGELRSVMLPPGLLRMGEGTLDPFRLGVAAAARVVGDQ
jgi:hypothetical protein